MTDEHQTLIALLAEEARLREMRQALFDQLYPRGTNIRWQGSGGIRTGIVVATAFGRRVFAADFKTGAGHWAGATSLIPPGETRPYQELMAQPSGAQP
tara:strand:+ start:3269 stop:3562 length:294 start_codon:yes stop_codon:yes gene_type:complete